MLKCQIVSLLQARGMEFESALSFLFFVSSSFLIPGSRRRGWAGTVYKFGFSRGHTRYPVPPAPTREREGVAGHKLRLQRHALPSLVPRPFSYLGLGTRLRVALLSPCSNYTESASTETDSCVTKFDIQYGKIDTSDSALHLSSV